MRIQQLRYRIICVLILRFTSCPKEKKTTKIDNDVIGKVEQVKAKFVSFYFKFVRNQRYVN